MHIVCYSYAINSRFLPLKPDMSETAQILNDYAFQGEEGTTYGFWNCGFIDNYVFGYFVQHFIETVEHIDHEKRNISKDVENASKHLFFIDFSKPRLVLQAKKAKGVPGRTEMIKRLATVFDLAFLNKILVGNYAQESYGHDRQTVLERFFNPESIVLEVSTEGLQLSNKRESFTFFNPHPETSDDLMREGKLILENVKKNEVRATDTGNLRKVPSIRFMVETAELPSIIVREHDRLAKYSPKFETEIRVSIEDPEQLDRDGFQLLIERVLAKLTGHTPINSNPASNQKTPSLFETPWGDDD